MITTQSDFVQPAVGSTVSVSMSPGSTADMAVGQVLFVDGGGGYYAISSITDPDNAVLTNFGAPDNSVPTTTISSGAAITPVVPNYQQGTMHTALFNSSSTWQAPFRVSTIIAYGCGGGGGGGSSAAANAAQGGHGSSYLTRSVTITPGSVYTINIGSGGMGGQSGANGADGQPSQIVDSGNTELLAFPAGTGGAGVPATGVSAAFGSSPQGSDAQANSGCGGGGGGGSGTGWSKGGNGGSGFVVIQYWI